MIVTETFGNLLTFSTHWDGTAFTWEAPIPHGHNPKEIQQTQTTGKRLAIQTWTTRVIHKLWEVIFKQWESHNAVIHLTPDSPEMKDKAWKALQETYAFQNAILPTDVPRLFPKTLAQWQDTNSMEILQWCQQVKPALENSRQCFIAQNRQCNSLLTEFFDHK